MKKIDKLVFGSFIGPFILTLVVVDFILLLVTLLKYFDQIMGKGLSAGVFAELITYFSISSSPDAFPLAILLSSIMTFGNLGEHSELTAVKSSGISLVRALLPIFIFVMLLTGFTYYSNTQLVPKTNLKTYSLLWDMRTKKPALDIREGVFYAGIPGYSIKVNEKIGDEQLKDIIIYDHTTEGAQGNKKVILADSGRMYSFLNQRYLALELYDGVRYEENVKDNYEDKKEGGQFVRDKFESSRMFFDLSSFDMSDTDESLFKRSRLVQTRRQLFEGVDSMQWEIHNKEEQLFTAVQNTYTLHFIKSQPVPKEISVPKALYDSLRNARIAAKLKLQAKDTTKKGEQAEEPEKLLRAQGGNLPARSNSTSPTQRRIGAKKIVVDQAVSIAGAKEKEVIVETEEEMMERFNAHFAPSSLSGTGATTHLTDGLNNGINRARSSRNLLNARIVGLNTVKRDQRKFVVTKHQQLARSLSCLIMFLIGAPIGAIIKKGGLGLPVIISVVFFLIYYIMNTMGEKWGKEGVMDEALAVWVSNAALLPFGLFFLRQARNDARIFESDFYLQAIERVKKLTTRKKELKTA